MRGSARVILWLESTSTKRVRWISRDIVSTKTGRSKSPSNSAMNSPRKPMSITRRVRLSSEGSQRYENQITATNAAASKIIQPHSTPSWTRGVISTTVLPGSTVAPVSLRIQSCILF